MKRLGSLILKYRALIVIVVGYGLARMFFPVSYRVAWYEAAIMGPVVALMGIAVWMVIGLALQYVGFGGGTLEELTKEFMHERTATATALLVVAMYAWGHSRTDRTVATLAHCVRTRMWEEQGEEAPSDRVQWCQEYLKQMDEDERVE